MAYFRLVVNPEAAKRFNRIEQAPCRGIGKLAVAKLVPFANQQAWSLLVPAANAALSPISGMPRGNLAQFGKKLQRLGQRRMH